MNKCSDRNKDQVLWKHVKGTFCYEKKCYHLREGFPKEPLSKEKAALNQSVQGDGTFWVEEKGIYRDLWKHVTFSEWIASGWLHVRW